MSEIVSERVPLETEKKPRGRPKTVRGRSKAGLTPQQAKLSKLQVRQNRAMKAHYANKRPPRVSLSSQYKLDFPEAVDKDSWYYHVFPDRNGLVQQAIGAHYDHVKDEAGNNITRQSGPYKEYLMKMPMTVRHEDLKKKDAKILKTITEKQQVDKSKGEYLPDDRDHVIQRDDYDPTNPLA